MRWISQLRESWILIGVALITIAALTGWIRAHRLGSQVLRHWAHFVDGWHCSSKAFYDRVCRALEERQVPKLTLVEQWHNESGVLSATRLYLCAKRRGQRIEVCAAPFGRGFFVSWWLIVPPSWLRLTPVLGWVIDLLAPPTLYALDTATMYQSVVHQAVQEVLDAELSTSGIRALSEDERKPILRDLFRR